MAEVRVKQGVLEGEVVDLVTGDGRFYSFKGIPYAEPPIGKLRFQEPKPPKPWTGVRKATDHGPSCYQKDIFSGCIVDGSEDCLYLNVYSPDLTPAAKLPVMVFIHGGGYKSGSGNDDFYGPDFLVAENVVLVTINYRLEALGFLCLDIPEVPGNAGLKDQVAALRWVQSNIENFGGDPNCVTIFGESAGGASTGFHVLTPMSKNLFQRAILMSGVPLCDFSLPYNPQKRAFLLGKQLGCATEDPHELLKFLQTVPVEKLVDTQLCLTTSEAVTQHPFKMFHFTPVVEKDFGQEALLLEEPLKLLAKNAINDVDVICGYTSHEAVIGLAIFKEELFADYLKYPDMFVPRRILYQNSTSSVISVAEEIMKHYFGKPYFPPESVKEFIKYATEVTFVHPIHKFLDLMCKTRKGKYYLYKISAVSERNVFGNQKENFDIVGTSHLDDLLYLFNATIFNFPLCKESKSYKIIKQTCGLFTNFAKYGNPTPDASLGVTWSPYDEESRRCLEIGEDLVPGADVSKDAVEFWDHIFEIAGVDCAKFLAP